MHKIKIHSYSAKRGSTMVKVNGHVRSRFYVGEGKTRSFLRMCALYLSLLLLVGIITAEFLIAFTPSHDVEAQIIERLVKIEDNSIPPVLVKIAEAESRNSHYCTEELVKHKLCAKSELGQVLVIGNKDGTVDVGRYAINVYHWGAKATALGLNIFLEQDNEKMALWIFYNHGTEPWYPSKHKWAK